MNQPFCSPLAFALSFVAASWGAFNSPNPTRPKCTLHLTVNAALFRTTGLGKLKGMPRSQSRCGATCTLRPRTWSATGTPHYPSVPLSIPHHQTLQTSDTIIASQCPSAPFSTSLHTASHVYPSVCHSTSLYPSVTPQHPSAPLSTPQLTSCKHPMASSPLSTLSTLRYPSVTPLSALWTPQYPSASFYTPLYPSSLSTLLYPSVSLYTPQHPSVTLCTPLNPSAPFCTPLYPSTPQLTTLHTAVSELLDTLHEFGNQQDSGSS